MGYGIYLGAAAATSLGYATGGNRIDFAKILPAVVRFDILPPYSLSTGVSKAPGSSRKLVFANLGI